MRWGGGHRPVVARQRRLVDGPTSDSGGGWVFGKQNKIK